MLHRIATCAKPTVARVQGAALGGGVGLTCACDMAVVADNASFSVSEAKFGILPAVIGPYVVNAVGKRNARYLALTTTRIDAATALTMGMVQRVTTLEALDAEVDRVVAELMDQLSVAPVSEQVRELTASTIARVRGTDEAREGFAAFLGKRLAQWIPQ
jgi:methylglutaconyl-CoA hydratase